MPPLTVFWNWVPIAMAFQNQKILFLAYARHLYGKYYGVQIVSFFQTQDFSSRMDLYKDSISKVVILLSLILFSSKLI
jgi:hypothetical protein